MSARGALSCREARVYVLATLLVAVALAPEVWATAPEYLADDAPAPASIEDEPNPMEEAYPAEVPVPSVFPRLKKRLEKAAPFWRDTQLLLHPRVYYFDRDRENANDSVALAYNSGWWRDRLMLSAAQRCTGHRGPTVRTTRTAPCC